jgi:flagellar biosynthetic protein FliR
MIPIQLETLLAWIALWAAPFLRLSGMFAIAPIFSAAGFNARTRGVLAVLTAALVAPMLPPPPVEDVFSSDGLLMAIREIGIGFAIGFILQIAFGAAVYAGQAAAMVMGLGFAMAVDPQNGIQVPVISQFYVILATLLFLSLDGHLVLLATIVDSYEVLPAMVSGMPITSISNIVALGGQVFAGGVLLALPVIATLLLVQVSLGVMTRAAPQLNIFAVGFPLTIIAGLVVLFLTMPGFIASLTQLLSNALLQSLAVFT